MTSSSENSGTVYNFSHDTNEKLSFSDARPPSASPISMIESGPASLKPSYDETHRKLKSRHIQLIGIGGTIGTALYIQIGRGLMQGGPASLLLAFSIW